MSGSFQASQYRKSLDVLSNPIPARDSKKRKFSSNQISASDSKKNNFSSYQMPSCDSKKKNFSCLGLKSLINLKEPSSPNFNDRNSKRVTLYNVCDVAWLNS